MRICIFLLSLLVFSSYSPAQAGKLHGQALIDSLRAGAGQLGNDSGSLRYMDALATAYRDIAPDSG